MILHRMKHGTERPIVFASLPLTNSERNYRQIDMEATAIFWELNKFLQYCYGRKTILITDEKPLVSILNSNKELPVTSALRLLHCITFMAGFNYEIK